MKATYTKVQGGKIFVSGEVKPDSEYEDVIFTPNYTATENEKRSSKKQKQDTTPTP